MIPAQTGTLTPLAGRVLAHVHDWTRAPTDAEVRAAGAALFDETNLDETIRAVETQITAQHGPGAFDHYRGWLLDEACEHVGVAIIDGEIRHVRSRVFLITLQGSSEVLENDGLVGDLAEDILTSFEPQPGVPEHLEFLPHAFTLGDLARIGPGQIREILRRSLAAFSEDNAIDWHGLIPGTADPAWLRSSPMLANGERALVGVSHALIDAADTGALVQFESLDYAQRWDRGVNAPTVDGLVRITATLTWTATLIALGLQRMHAGFTAEAIALGRRIENPLLHYAPAADQTVVAWLEDGPELYGPMRIPAAAVMASEITFQGHATFVAPFFLRYASEEHLPTKSTESPRRAH